MFRFSVMSFSFAVAAALDSPGMTCAVVFDTYANFEAKSQIDGFCLANIAREIRSSQCFKK